MNKKVITNLGLLTRRFVWTLKDKIDLYDNYECGCAVAAYTLSLLLKKRYKKYKINFVMGTYDNADHCWVKLNGWIVDPTATQFGIEDPTYITLDNNSLYLEESTNDKALKEINYTWCREQRPKSYKSEIDNFIKSARL